MTSRVASIALLAALVALNAPGDTWASPAQRCPAIPLQTTVKVGSPLEGGGTEASFQVSLVGFEWKYQFTKVILPVGMSSELLARATARGVKVSFPLELPFFQWWINTHRTELSALVQGSQMEPCLSQSIIAAPTAGLRLLMTWVSEGRLTELEKLVDEYISTLREGARPTETEAVNSAIKASPAIGRLFRSAKNQRISVGVSTLKIRSDLDREWRQALEKVRRSEAGLPILQEDPPLVRIPVAEALENELTECVGKQPEETITGVNLFVMPLPATDYEVLITVSPVSEPPPPNVKQLNLEPPVYEIRVEIFNRGLFTHIATENPALAEPLRRASLWKEDAEHLRTYTFFASLRPDGRARTVCEQIKTRIVDKLNIDQRRVRTLLEELPQ